MKKQKTKARKSKGFYILGMNALSTEEERIQYLALWEPALRKAGLLSDDEDLKYGETLSEFRMVKKSIKIENFSDTKEKTSRMNNLENVHQAFHKLSSELNGAARMRCQAAICALSDDLAGVKKFLLAARDEQETDIPVNETTYEMLRKLALNVEISGDRLKCLAAIAALADDLVCVEQTLAASKDY